MNNQKEEPTKQIAILIDLENASLNSMRHLFEQISLEGRLIVKRAYADWSRASKNRDQLLELGIQPIQLFRSAARKNSNDILLAIDAVDLLHTSPTIDIFVIVSSDSDFIPLVNRLRASGKTVFCAGEQAKMSTLIKSCDKYFYLNQDNNTDETVKTSLPITIKPRDVLSIPNSIVNVPPKEPWEKIDLAWSQKAPIKGNSIPGPNAASEAAKILEASKLSATPYKTLQGILNASKFLSEKWIRNRNTIIRR
jgi:uncharacterized protein (TIGR00288 family)